MRGFQRLSLRFRIAGGVLAGLVVLFTFFGLLVVRTINLSTDAALQERLRLAEITARSVDSLLDHTARQLEKTATLLAALEDGQAEQQGARLWDVLGEFHRIIALDEEGRVLWAVPRTTNGATWDFEDDEAVRAAVRSGGLSVVSPAAHGSPDRLLAIIIAPLPAGEGRSAGFLAGELGTSHHGIGLLELPGTEGSVRGEIVDAAGLIVTTSGRADAGPPDEHVEILAQLIADRQPATTIHRVADGADHVVAYQPFAALPGGVVVEQTEDVALVIPREMQRTLLVYGAAALAIASAAAWLHAHSVVRPIRRLTGDAARMASGDLESPIAVSRDDEIGELARRFDEIRVKLKASLEESARWAEELEHRVDERTREVEERNRELSALNRDRRQLLAKTISAQEEERKRLARELHDDSAQTLTAVLMTLKTAEDALPAAPEGARLALGRSRSQLEVALREIRKAIVDLRPSALDDLGLAAAVRWYADEHLRPLGIKVAFEIGGDEQRATGAAATAIFRIVQEAVNNVGRHSGARQARITLEFGPSAVLTVVEDDGTGFDPEGLRQPQESGRGLGLLGMRERAELFGGDVEIESSAGQGTSVRVRIPYA
jgi:signal transduction histidine kinase